MTPDEKRAWEMRAKREGSSLNMWVREACRERYDKQAVAPQCAIAGCDGRATYNSTREMMRRGTKPYCAAHKGGKS